MEETLATNINPDDPNEIDNNNYKAKQILVIGSKRGQDPDVPVIPRNELILPPDLDLVVVTSDFNGRGGDPFTVSWTVTM